MSKYNRILRSISQNTQIATVIARYRAAFSPLALSDLTCTELLAPQLQKIASRPDYYENLHTLGNKLLEIHLNDYLGAQNVKITDKILQEYTKSNRIQELILYGGDFTPTLDEASALIKHTLAAVHLGIGSQAAAEVANRICGGTGGLANAYIYSW